MFFQIDHLSKICTEAMELQNLPVVIETNATNVPNTELLDSEAAASPEINASAQEINCDELVLPEFTGHKSIDTAITDSTESNAETDNSCQQPLLQETLASSESQSTLELDFTMDCAPSIDDMDTQEPKTSELSTADEKGANLVLSFQYIKLPHMRDL